MILPNKDPLANLLPIMHHHTITPITILHHTHTIHMLVIFLLPIITLHPTDLILLTDQEDLPFVGVGVDLLLLEEEDLMVVHRDHPMATGEVDHLLLGKGTDDGRDQIEIEKETGIGTGVDGIDMALVMDHLLLEGVVDIPMEVIVETEINTEIETGIGIGIVDDMGNELLKGVIVHHRHDVVFDKYIYSKYGWSFMDIFHVFIYSFIYNYL